MLLSQGAGKLAGFAFVLIVARGLGTNDYGYFNFAISFAPLFLIFGAWGINIVVASDIAREPERVSEVFSSGFVLRFGLELLGLLACLASAPFFVHHFTPWLTVAIVAAALLLDDVSGYLGNVFRAFEQMRYQSVVTLVNRIASTVLALVAVVLGGGLIAVAAMYFLGSLGALLLALRTLRRKFPPIRLADRRRELVRRLLRSGFLVGIASALSMALFRIDTVLLQGIRGTRDVALYGVAYRFIDSFLFFAWGVVNAAIPLLARAEGREGRARAFQLPVALLLAFYLPLLVWPVFCSRWLVVTLFSDRYAAAAPAVPWLAASAAFYAAAYLARVSAIAAGRRVALVWIAAVGVAVNVGVNAVVIPRHGFVGAAVVTFASEVLDAALLLVLAGRADLTLYLSRLAAVPLTAAAAMAVFLFATGLRDAGAFVAGGLVYVAALAVAARLIAPDESRRALALLRRRASPRAPVPESPV
jgi:O-antigen/teichoic acid export membrane protein